MTLRTRLKNQENQPSQESGWTYRRWMIQLWKSDFQVRVRLTTCHNTHSHFNKAAPDTTAELLDTTGPASRVRLELVRRLDWDWLVTLWDKSRDAVSALSGREFLKQAGQVRLSRGAVCFSNTFVWLRNGVSPLTVWDGFCNSRTNLTTSYCFGWLFLICVPSFCYIVLRFNQLYICFLSKSNFITGRLFLMSAMRWCLTHSLCFD